MSIINGELKYECLREASNEAVEQGQPDKGHINEVIAAVVEEVNGCGGAWCRGKTDTTCPIYGIGSTTDLPLRTVIKGDRGDLGGDRVAIEGGA